MILDDLRKIAQENRKRIIIIEITPAEKLMYRDGQIYIILDGFGTVKRHLYPAEIRKIKQKIKNGEYRCY